MMTTRQASALACGGEVKSGAAEITRVSSAGVGDEGIMRTGQPSGHYTGLREMSERGNAQGHGLR